MRTRATRRLSPLWLALVLVFNVSAASALDRPPVPMTALEVQAIVDEFSAALALKVRVTVSVVDINPLLVSVDPPKGDKRTFEISLEASFLEQLDEEGLRAVIAHELGHVWIFGHHPYLQTERGANQIAMRVVSRESLEKIYDKVFARVGVKGTLAHFLGLEN
jgi:Peptidase family M48